jgi:hypothetical protein
MGNERAHERRRIGRAVGVVAGVLGGVACGALAVSLATAAGTSGGVAQALIAPIEATHLPPLLTLEGESLDLRYDVYCLAGAQAVDEPCAAEGSVFVRSGDSGAYTKLEIEEHPTVLDGRFRVTLPTSIAHSRAGFSYYAEFRSIATGAVTTVPEGGADAPQRSLRLERPVRVDLGVHRFGNHASPSARIAQSAWGRSPLDAGLEPGDNLAPIGASSFDVAADGTVHVLDEAHRRVLRWERGAERPTSVPLAVNGTIADLAVAGDGTLHVLETTAAAGREPFLRSFGTAGNTLSATPVGHGSAQVRIGPGGTAVVRKQPSAQWQAIARDGNPLSASARSASGRAGRPLRDGRELVVLRTGEEIRVALTGGRGRVRSWVIESATPLGEVQLAEPAGDSLVLVTRAYTEDEHEFLVLVLDDRGLVRRFALPPSDWAETAPLSRFRLVGWSLYRLGSSPEGVFVDRYDIEGRSR